MIQFAAIILLLTKYHCPCLCYSRSRDNQILTGCPKFFLVLCFINSENTVMITSFCSNNIKIFSLFVVGKRYVFDIQRTLRESYDYARRILYTAETTRSCPSAAEDDSLASVINGSVLMLPESHLSCSSTCQVNIKPLIYIFYI